MILDRPQFVLFSRFTPAHWAVFFHSPLCPIWAFFLLSHL